MVRHLPHIGLRTVKTSLAVALGLFFADLRGSPSPIFAAIGAIGAMGRTIDDALDTCLTQFFGILLGASFGTIFAALFHDTHYVGIGLGLVTLIFLCVQLKFQFAVSLASIVFISICLSPADDAFFYGVNRLLDTMIGLATALVINVTLKPYNNRERINKMLTHFLQSVPHYVDQRVLHGNYPDLSPLQAQLDLISQELTVFAKLRGPHSQKHQEQTIYLRGCEQLAQSLMHELGTLCAMDEKEERLSPENAGRLALLSLTVPDSLSSPCKTEADIVANYHLANLLNSYDYLNAFILMA